MPRQARLDVPGALHHIIVRGINKSPIFADDQDKTRFLERLGHNVSEGKAAVYAWTLMSNHVHILFRSGKDGISAVMRKLLTWYAQYHNRRQNRTGHLFENRYKSILCEEENYLLALVRYIHLNPVRANIIQTMEQLDTYPWNGHGVILGNAGYTWMDTEFVLSQFGNTRRKAVAEYRRFVQEGMEHKHNPTFSGGGLVRSFGGWSHVLSAQRKGQPEETDERILGSGDFVHAVIKDAEEQQLRQLKLRRGGRTMTEIIKEECTRSRINQHELEHGNRRSAVSQARAKIACRSKDELGLSAAEIARRLGVATSSITRAIKREQTGKEVTQRK